MKTDSIEEKKQAAVIAIADYMNLVFPDHIPDPASPELYQAACHVAYAANERVLRPARQLVALKQIQLPKLTAALRAALSGVDEALAERKKQQFEVTKLTAQLATVHAGGTVNQNATALQDKLDNIRNWLAAAVELSKGSDKLAAALTGAAQAIGPMVLLQNDFQRSWAPFGKWAATIYLATRTADIETRAKQLCTIANAAIGELEQLQNGELPTMRNRTKRLMLLDFQQDE